MTETIPSVPPGFVSLPDGIFAIDTEYLRPLMDASHLLVHEGRAAFVDTGTSLAVPHLLDGLERAGVAAADVDYVFLTHVHLDHAGGAGRLMESLPNARAVLHPRGAPHMIDPGKLIAGSRAVYGDARFDALYGEIVPIPEERVIVTDHEQRFEVGGRPLLCLHTPGHALHHYCLVDLDYAGVFTGDTVGVSYREFDTGAGAFVLPTTTPTQFDPEAMHASLDLIMSFEPQAAYLTHYSRVTDLHKLARDMHRRLDEFVAIAFDCEELTDRKARIEERLFAYLDTELTEHGVTLDTEARRAVLDGDMDLNAQGLDVWLARLAKQKGATS